MTKTNPIIKLVKENDIVLFEVKGFTSTAKQICRVHGLKYLPEDEHYSFAWLEFNVDVLYTTVRMHPSLMHECIGNCMAMVEIIPEAIVDMYAKNHNMWKAEDYMMSTEELEATRERIKNEMDELSKF